MPPLPPTHKPPTPPYLFRLLDLLFDGGEVYQLLAEPADAERLQTWLDSTRCDFALFRHTGGGWVGVATSAPGWARGEKVAGRQGAGFFLSLCRSLELGDCVLSEGWSHLCSL